MIAVRGRLSISVPSRSNTTIGVGCPGVGTQRAMMRFISAAWSAGGRRLYVIDDDAHVAHGTSSRKLVLECLTPLPLGLPCASMAGAATPSLTGRLAAAYRARASSRSDAICSDPWA